MARKRKPAEPANHERWLVSYADFITLLFAFFVMMYANSQTDKARAQGISQAFREAIEEGRISHAFSRWMSGDQQKGQHRDPGAFIGNQPQTQGGKKTVELLPSLKQLNSTLKNDIDKGTLEVRMENRGLVISLKEATFFPSGGDAVEPTTLPVLEAIAHEIGKHPNPIRLEGHTDSVPIHTPRYRSNWDLSAARGIAMLDLFSEKFGIDPSRMAISGYADTAPVASNDTNEGRARNRRVDIVVLNEVAAANEPVQSRQ